MHLMSVIVQLTGDLICDFSVEVQIETNVEEPVQF